MSSKTLSAIPCLAGLVAAASLAACAAPPEDQDHGWHHPARSASATASDAAGSYPAQGGTAGTAMTGSEAGCGMMGEGTMGSQGACPMKGDSKDKASMCAMYQSMRDAPSQQARQNMMDRHMQGMSPEMRQHCMEAMRQQCQ